MAIPEAILRIMRISSRVAPAASAARMCRRVPSGFRFVQAAFSATPTSSTNLRGRMPLSQGLSVMVAQIAAHDDSQLRSFSSAESHGPVDIGSRPSR